MLSGVWDMKAKRIAPQRHTALSRTRLQMEWRHPRRLRVIADGEGGVGGRRCVYCSVAPITSFFYE